MPVINWVLKPKNIHAKKFWLNQIHDDQPTVSKHWRQMHCRYTAPLKEQDMLWRCWLGSRKGIWPVKNWVLVWLLAVSKEETDVHTTAGLGRAVKNWVLVWLSVCSKVQTCIWPSWYHCHSPSLASAKSRLILPFRYQLTWVVLEKRPLNVCARVCVK